MTKVVVKVMEVMVMTVMVMIMVEVMKGKKVRHNRQFVYYFCNMNK